MQVQRIQNNNYNTTFGERLIFDKKLISRATKTTVKSIIDDLYSRFDKSNSERIKSRKIEDAFDDSRLI